MAHVRTAVVAGLLLLAATATSCGQADRKDVEATAAVKADPVVLASQATPTRRDVVYTSTLVIRAASIAKATDEAEAIAERAGGFVFASKTDVGEDTTMTIRVPSDQFDETMARLAGLGRELQRDVKAQDVTAEVVDVEGRLKTAQASANRLRTLLAQSASAPDIVAVEAELAKRESEIEAQQGRLRVLSDQVALATVNLRLTKRTDLAVSKDLPGFLGGLRAGAVAVVNVGQGLLVIVGFLLPFVPFLVLAVWLLRRYRRRHPRRQPAAGPPPSWPQPPAGGPPPSWPEPPAGGSTPPSPVAATTQQSSL